MKLIEKISRFKLINKYNNILMENYGLPKIDENLSSEVFEHRLKYKRLYLNLINRCKNMKEEELSGYNEKHHILPRCMGGKNDKENLVIMPVRYHVMAHIILFEIYPENFELAYALNMILNGSSSNDIMRERTLSINKHFSSKTIARSREESRKAISKSYIESNNPNRQQVISPDGRIFNSIKEASRLSGIPYSTLTKWLNEKDTGNGWKYSKRSKIVYKNRDLSKSSKRIISPEGRIYNSIKEACTDNNIAYTTMRYWLSGRVKNDHGWKFI
jgi:hypothetical protein